MDHPLVLTQWRRACHSGLLAPTAIVGLTALCILAAFLGRLPEEQNPASIGRSYYGWLLTLQALVWLPAVFAKILNTLGEEKANGLLETNWLTPLPAHSLLVGYWLGAPLREFLLGIIPAACGLVIVIICRLPLESWLASQVLLATSALFGGLVAVVLGLVLKNFRLAYLASALALIPAAQFLAAGKFSLLNYLIPIYPIVRLFPGAETSSLVVASAWKGATLFYSLEIPGWLYAIGAQAAFGFILAQGALRKFSFPLQPIFGLWQPTTLFFLTGVLQYGLLGTSPSDFARTAVQTALMALGLALITLNTNSTPPLGQTYPAPGHRSLPFLRSGVALALALGILAAAFLFLNKPQDSPEATLQLAVSAASLLLLFLLFAAWLEFTRWFNPRPKGRSLTIAGLFIFLALPFVLSLSFQAGELTLFSFLALPIAALNLSDLGLEWALGALALQAVVTLLVLTLWLAQWKRTHRSHTPPPLPG